jgi:hypothetical protein
VRKENRKPTRESRSVFLFMAWASPSPLQGARSCTDDEQKRTQAAMLLTGIEACSFEAQPASVDVEATGIRHDLWGLDDGAQSRGGGISSIPEPLKLCVL